MRHRAGWKNLATALPVDSDVCRDLKSFCEEMGDIDYATAIRLILIAWSKARRGQLGQVWGFSSLGSGVMHPFVQAPPTEPAQENGQKEESRKRQAVAKRAVDALDLDL